MNNRKADNENDGKSPFLGALVSKHDTRLGLSVYRKQLTPTDIYMLRPAIIPYINFLVLEPSRFQTKATYSPNLKQPGKLTPKLIY